MKHFFYPHLALSNIKKNKQIYCPYLLSSTFTIAMYYIIHSLSVNSGYANLKVGRTMLPYIMNLGTWVVLIFSVIFLFYINSFLIKRRKKEIALYNILGMEKKHVMIMMLFETVMTSLFSIIVGILFGVIFSKLMFLLMLNIAHINVFDFIIPLDSIIFTIEIYLTIFMIAYLFNIIQIKLTNPIELLRGSETGEKEPKTKWLMTVIGILTLSSGYYIAQTIKDPGEAMLLFFVAVILVIIGTYCIFTAGSITILKLLKKNKRFYYQTRHFTSISQLIYRMKQNAVGLASICILCTCILVMLSSTVSLYISIQDSSNMLSNEQLEIKLGIGDNQQTIDNKEFDQIIQSIQQDFKGHHIQTTTMITRKNYSLHGSYKHHEFISGRYDETGYINLTAFSLDEFNKAYHLNNQLQDNEVLIASNYTDFNKTIKINGHIFQIKKIINQPYFLKQKYQEIDKCISIVFSNDALLQSVLFNEDYKTSPVMSLSIDFKDIKQSEKAISIIQKNIPKNIYVYINSQYEQQKEYFEIFGGLFFLGIFLGILFLMATVLMMYYKQLSEGYEDQKRYEIMQNVGMSQREVKQSIRSQVLIFFFLPLIVAMIHMAFAFKMIVKMFSEFLVSRPSLFMMCTIISMIILLIIYSVVYTLTAKVYYKIVSTH